MKLTHHSRRGLTLLEVVVALVIFMISFLAINQLITFGRERALDVRLQTRTSLRCQAKLAEVIVGAVPMQSTGGYSGFDDEKDKDLQWSLAVDDVGFAGARQIKISVKAELASGRIFESHLAQIILDPEIRGSTLDPPPAAVQAGSATKDAPESSTPSATTSGSTGTSGSGTTGVTGGGGTKMGTGAVPTLPAATPPAAATPKGS